MSSMPQAPTSSGSASCPRYAHRRLRLPHTDRSLTTDTQDAYWAHGFEHQFVMVVPSRKAVIVRLGRTPDVTKWDLARFFRVVFQALPS